jgi:hypothetical protein
MQPHAFGVWVMLGGKNGALELFLLQDHCQIETFKAYFKA